jgi:ERCC4-type nuclease
MSTNTAVRPGELRDPEAGDIYEDKHGSTYQLIHVDDHIALLRDEQTDDTGQYYHRIETRIDFDHQRDAGFFELQQDSDLELRHRVEPNWTDVNHIGAKSAESLREAGFKTATDVLEADKSELKGVSGIGAKAVQNLTEFVR